MLLGRAVEPSAAGSGPRPHHRRPRHVPGQRHLKMPAGQQQQGNTHTHTHRIISLLKVLLGLQLAHSLDLSFCPSLQSLLNQLRAIFDQIIEFQSAQDSLYRSALEELALRLQFEERKQQREEEVGGA